MGRKPKDVAPETPALIEPPPAPTILVRRSDLGIAPELHLDRLMDVLGQVPDGYRTTRRADGTWEAETEGDALTVRTESCCGFAEEGDGKVLTLITGRVAENNGTLTLSTRKLFRHPTPTLPRTWMDTAWTATLTLGSDMPIGHDPWYCPRQGSVGAGEGDVPGVAALLAYLQAWGVLEC